MVIMELIGEIMNDQKFTIRQICEHCLKTPEILVKYGGQDCNNDILCRACYSQEVRNAIAQNKDRHIDDFIDIIKIITNIERI
jgi:hypothetical protein